MQARVATIQFTPSLIPGCRGMGQHPNPLQKVPEARHHRFKPEVSWISQFTYPGRTKGWSGPDNLPVWRPPHIQEHVVKHLIVTRSNPWSFDSKHNTLSLNYQATLLNSNCNVYLDLFSSHQPTCNDTILEPSDWVTFLPNFLNLLASSVTAHRIRNTTLCTRSTL